MQSFERLIKTVDQLVESGQIRSEVVIQTGYTNFTPKFCKHFRFVDSEKFEKLCRDAEIIITHAGAGSIATALMYNKPTIVVPRLKKFDEHVDDHQLQIAKEMAKSKRVIAVYDVGNLLKAVRMAKRWKVKKFVKHNKISELIENFLDSM